MQPPFVVFLSVLLLWPSLALAHSCAPPAPALEDEGALDVRYAAASLVYLARVETSDLVEHEEGWSIRRVTLSTYPPALKSAVPRAVNYRMAGPCGLHFAEGEVYLFLVNSLAEQPGSASVRLVMLEETGPEYMWVLDWIEAKRAVKP